MNEILFEAEIKIFRHISKKNSRPIHGRGNRKWIGKSADLKRAEWILTTELDSIRRKTGLKTIDFNVQVTFLFYFEDYYTKTGAPSKTILDLINAIELPADCLEAAEILENDRLIKSLDGSRTLPGDKNKIHIIIRKLNE